MFEHYERQRQEQRRRRSMHLLSLTGANKTDGATVNVIIDIDDDRKVTDFRSAVGISVFTFCG